MSPPADQVVRAITTDDTFRVMVASTTATVQRIVEAQQVSGPTACHVADLVTGTVLLRETMAPHHRLQAILSGKDGRGQLVADAHPEGGARGLVHLPGETPAFELGPGSMLQVMRTMANGSVYRGVVSAAELGDVPSVLMSYLQESEQIVSVLATGARWRAGSVQAAGGYVVQLLPEASRDALRAMTERLESLPPIEELLARTDGSAMRLLDELAGSQPFCQLDDRPIRFHCWCDAESVIASLATLSREDLAELVQDQEVLELRCDYCHTDYRVGRPQLQGLLESS